MQASDLYQMLGCAVANIVILQNGSRVSSGTGFVIGGKLVTCAHVVTLPPGLEVRVQFEKLADGQHPDWSYAQVSDAFKGYSEENSFDYAILEPPSGLSLPPNLRWAEEPPLVGEAVACLGYPFEDPHLTLHQGYVSAVFRSGPATMLKLDMSVNPSNSGGPLLRLSDGAVVGMVARKATGLTESFDKLIASFDANVLVLQKAQGGVFMSGIDPLAVLEATQHQMKIAAAQIRRSANVGIGYAVWISPLREEAALTV